MSRPVTPGLDPPADANPPTRPTHTPLAWIWVQVAPPLGLASTGHLLPQPLQLLSSVKMSTHVVPHITSGLLHVHVPAWHEPFPPWHGVPLPAVGLEHTPPLQVPATWHSSLATQETGVPPHVPAVH